MRGSAKQNNDKSRVKVKVFALDGQPIDTEANVVEVVVSMHFIKYILISSSVMHYPLIVSIPMGVSKSTEVWTGCLNIILMWIVDGSWRIVLYVASAPYYGFFRRREKGRNTIEGLAQTVLRRTSPHALRWDGRLVESQEGLETKVGLRANLVPDSFHGGQLLHGTIFSNSTIEAALMCLGSARLTNCAQTPHIGSVAWFYVMGECGCYENRVLVWCLVSNGYEMPKLVSNNLVIGSRFFPWRPTFAWNDFFKFKYRSCTDVSWFDDFGTRDGTVSC
ncbi:hypothetical protein M9H77_04188 [Catharanthus roseus]|uniref:Uncharacterized protein n=1 Tax=Catharanthus roseus TaxID=4058 RepID=A0ACC0CDI7_CATRO|nr:hypothetical protein M9H77_04188 [Catharanthus roseus]